MRRDPYAIYAEYILGLKALEPVERDIGPRESGIAWHAALEEFIEATRPAPRSPPTRANVSIRIARDRFASLRADPAFAALHWPNIETGLDFFLAFERRIAGRGLADLGRTQGAIPVPLASGAPFKLSARADRIDLLRSGGARLIDYKSGSTPGPREVEVGFAPQLTLEAAMLQPGRISGVAGP